MKMKKIAGLVLSSLLTIGFAFAQDATTETEEGATKKEKEPKAEKAASSAGMSFTSKNGHEVLPQEGDYAIGLNATPVITSIAGNGTDAGHNWINEHHTIFGKYFLDGQTAIRAQFRLGISDMEYNNFVARNNYVDYGSGDPDNQGNQVEDKLAISRTYFAIGGGLEKRRGSGRLVGVYGAEVLFHLTSISEGYEYGNAYTLENNSPESTNWGVIYGDNLADDVVFGNTSTDTERILERQYDNLWALQARVFGGVEYFVAPKISLGAEFGWSYVYQFSGNTTEKWEHVEGGQIGNEVRNVQRNDGNGMVIDTDNFDGQINAFFHF